jgi:hypothetical protein
MGVRSFDVDCNSAGFEKGELVHVIQQYLVSGSQVLQKAVVLHHSIRLDGCQRQIVGIGARVGWDCQDVPIH